jgi:hypothetical protein
MSEYEIKALHKLGETVFEGKWSNEGLVQLIELAGGFLNLMTIADYANKHNVSYQASKKDTQYRKNTTIFNTKYVIDNY